MNTNATTPRQKIEELQGEVARLEKVMANCQHTFTDPKFDPETVKEGYGSVQDGFGSDPHWSFAGYRDVQKDRWSRECTLCGHVEYTYEQVPIVKGYAPKF